MSAINKSVSIAVFLDGGGRIKQLPVPNRTRLPVLAYLTGKFELGRDYSEKEVNELITRWHTFEDFHLLRRLLIDYGFLSRTPSGSRYWVIEKKSQGCENE